jgi:hypothetical protein
MSEQPGENGPSPMLSRAEQVLNQTQQRAKELLGTTGHQLQQTMHDLQTKASHVTQSQSTSTSQSGDGAATGPTTERPATERAEQLISTLGQHLEVWSARAGQQVARTTARLREDAEDIWVEAQHMCSTHEPHK